MSAYVIVEISVHNPEEYEEYKRLSTISLAAFNGKFIVRGGQTETLEGDWVPERIVVLEFPDMQTARNWWNSDIYAEAKAIRQRTAESRMILVQGT